MPAWLEKTVSIGDILTIFSILIAAFGAITAWRTEIETRQRTQAEAVRKAAAEVIAKTERRFEISEWIFEDIQPDIISATILAASKDLPPGVSYSLDPKDDRVQRWHLRAARDFLYKQIADAHQRGRKRQLDEQLEMSYTGLYSYIPEARRFIQDATRSLRYADSQMMEALQANAERQILYFSGDTSDTAGLGNCLRWAVETTKGKFDERSDAIVREVVGALSPILSATNDVILQGLNDPKRFRLDRNIALGDLAKTDASAPPSSGCAKLAK
jgi:hypothetical protein